MQNLLCGRALITPTCKEGNGDMLARAVQDKKNPDKPDGKGGVKGHLGGSKVRSRNSNLTQAQGCRASVTRGLPAVAVQVYSSISNALDVLRDSHSDHEKWLVFLSDLVDFSCGGLPENDPKYRVKDKEVKFDSAKAELKRLAKETADKMRSMAGTSFIAIDASEIAMWCPSHKMWPTWRDNVKELAQVAESQGGTGMYLQAKNTKAIEEAFEEVAAAMVPDMGGVAE